MKHHLALLHTMVLLAVLLAGCGRGQDGGDGQPYMTFDAENSIGAVDFSDIGAQPDASGHYYKNTLYLIHPGTGTIYWSGSGSVWFATVTIEPGTPGTDAPLDGITGKDGDPGHNRLYDFYLMPGAYDLNATIQSVDLQKAPEAIPSFAPVETR